MNVEYLILAALFSLGSSTVEKIDLETCHAIATNLLPQDVVIPQGEKLKEVVDVVEIC